MTEVICKEIAEERAGICEFDGLRRNIELATHSALERADIDRWLAVAVTLDLARVRVEGHSANPICSCFTGAGANSVVWRCAFSMR